MCKRQVLPFKWGYMNNENENEAENEKYLKQINIKYISSRYDINRPWRRHGHKYIRYKICLSTIMVICIKQQLGNI